MLYLLSFLLMAAVSLARPNREIYEKIPQVDIDEVLTNDAVLEHHFNCVMERSDCPDLIDQIKLIVPELVSTNCAMCTEEERAVVRRVTTHVRETKPDMWKEFCDRYDPERKFDP
ncbi:hypothetical protein HHI36_003658 [Cryptolaemus montrouzieri]|uniref:Chemosensory protein n=1 Tax=Cryptolaemus montrouzieri TaxID=559131 RepID=A0ABD2PEM9_9CUCU